MALDGINGPQLQPDIVTEDLKAVVDLGGFGAEGSAVADAEKFLDAELERLAAITRIKDGLVTRLSTLNPEYFLLQPGLGRFEF